MVGTGGSATGEWTRESPQPNGAIAIGSGGVAPLSQPGPSPSRRRPRSALRARACGEQRWHRENPSSFDWRGVFCCPAQAGGAAPAAAFTQTLNGGAMATRKFYLDESEMPTAVVQHRRGPADAAAAAAPPGNARADRPGGAGAALPDGADQAGSQHRALHRRSRTRCARSTSIWRPTPLIRATFLEKALDTPAHIYYKYEGVSPSGSHKPNTAVAQAYYNKQEGVKRIATETGAGQWGSSLAFACQHVRHRVQGLHGEGQLRPEAVPPLDDASSGAARWSPAPARTPTPAAPSLAEDPDSTRLARHRHQRGRRGRGHARGHEVLAGQRAQPRPAAPDRHRPGGDQADGDGRASTRTSSSAARAAARTSPGSCSRSCRSGSTGAPQDPLPRRRAGILPEPDEGRIPLRLRRHRRPDAADEDVHARPHVHAAGHPRRRAALPRHGAACSATCTTSGYIEARAYPQNPCFEAAILFARTEGIIPAPESSHAIRGAIDEALAAKEAGESRVILFNLSGHGLLDLAGLRRLPRRPPRR